MAAAPSVPLDPWAWGAISVRYVSITRNLGQLTARHPCGPEHPIFLLIAITCATLESIGSGRGAGAGDEWTRIIDGQLSSGGESSSAMDIPNDAETKRRVKIWNARGNIFRRFNGDVGINGVV